MTYQKRALARKVRLAAKLKVRPEFIDFLVWNLLILYFAVVFMLV